MSKITVDIFELYSLYNLLDYTNYPGLTIILDIASNITRILLILDGKLIYVRALSKGMLTIAKLVAEKISYDPGQVFEQLLKFGLEKNQEELNSLIKKELESFAYEIKFTIKSYLEKRAGLQQDIETLILTEYGHQVPNLQEIFDHGFAKKIDFLNFPKISKAAKKINFELPAANHNERSLSQQRHQLAYH